MSKQERIDAESQIRSSLGVRTASNNRLVDASEVEYWPSGFLDQLVNDGTLSASKNAESISCDSCGQDHIEKVQYTRYPDSTLRASIICPNLGRVQIPLHRLLRWSINYTANHIADSKQEPAFGSNTDLAVDEPLCDRAQDILVAMLEMGLVSSDKRDSFDNITKRARGNNSDSNGMKKVQSSLVRMGFTQSKKGRGGGSWLTQKGILRSQKLSED